MKLRWQAYPPGPPIRIHTREIVLDANDLCDSADLRRQPQDEASHSELQLHDTRATEQAVLRARALFQKVLFHAVLVVASACASFPSE